MRHGGDGWGGRLVFDIQRRSREHLLPTGTQWRLLPDWTGLRLAAGCTMLHTLNP